MSPSQPVHPFHVQAIPAAELNAYRSSGEDRFGNPFVVTINDEAGGAPLRCCLTEARIGQAVALAAYRPFPFDGHYAEVGPVYVHAEPCAGYKDTGRYPASFRHRKQVLRAYGHNRILGAELVEGADAERVISRLLANPEVAFLHSRNVLYGCYMFSIHRVPS